MRFFQKLDKYAGGVRGFTVLELVVACSVLAILAGITAPKLSELNRSFEHLNAQAYLMQDLKRAQAEAITQGCRGVFEIRADKRGYTFGCDYLEYDTGSPPQHDVLSLSRTLPAHVQISVPSPIIFNSRGQAVDEAGIQSTLAIQLDDISKGRSTFATGTLLGTGVFSFN